MDLKKLKTHVVLKDEEEKFKSLLAQYHYLGAVPEIFKLGVGPQIRGRT